MKCSHVISLALATTVAVTGLAAPAGATQVRPLLQGVVVDQGGRYVDDVRVLAVRPDGSVAASDLSYASARPDGPQHGYFFLAVVDPGTYTVKLAKSAYVATSLGNHHVTSGGVVSLGEVSLRKKRVASSTAVSLADSSLRPGQRGRATVDVDTAATGRPTGQVTLFVDGRRHDRTRLRGSHPGSLAFTLPRLGQGNHQVRATWSGSTYVKGSASKAVTLRVRRVWHRAWVPGKNLLRLTP